jgi:iron(III) transport system permease protein
VWVAQTFAFTPIAFMIMRGVVQGVAPSMEEAAQTLRASPQQTFMTVTLPLLKPGLANAFLVGFIESIADFGNPIVVGGQFSVLSTEIFFAIVGAQYDQGRAASLAWILTAVCAHRVCASARPAGQAELHHRQWQGRFGHSDAAARRRAPLINSVALPWMAFTVVVYLFAFAGGFVQTWGRDYTFTLNHFKPHLRWSGVSSAWSGRAPPGTRFSPPSSWPAICAHDGSGGSADRLAAGAHRVSRAGRVRVCGAAGVCHPRHGAGGELHPGLQCAAVRADGHRLIIVLCFMFRNLPVGVRAGTAAFKQLDKSLDEASLMLRASTVQTLRHVVLPLLKPALVAALVYSFVRAMTTVSAVIFWLPPRTSSPPPTSSAGWQRRLRRGAGLLHGADHPDVAGDALIQFVVGERKLGRRKPVPERLKLTSGTAN